MELCRYATERGTTARVYKADLSRQSETVSLVAKCEQNAGPIDVLIHSASVFYKTPEPTPQDWERFFAVNTQAAFYLIQQATRQMKKGVVITLTDVLAEKPIPGFLPYCASKAALHSLTLGFARVLAPGVRVGAIAGGNILPPDGASPESIQRHGADSLFERWGEPNDIVQAVRFFIENDYLTGVSLNVDGGLLLK